ncbi:MAG: heme biosynthesis protein HemY [Burkholderiales bacterium]|nr:heme biosynthesis protein HemY [Burkholderiales bacterium]
MRRIIWSMLIVSAAVGLAMLMRFNHGNVAVLWPPYRIDFSVNLAVLVLAIAFLVFHLLLATFSNALNLPARVREYRERRRRESALAGLRDSLLALFEGRFGRAERLAQSALGDRSLAGVASLVAARAAHRMRETERRDRWLEAAGEEPGIANAQLMTTAELAVEDHRPSDAVAAIGKLQAGGPRHIHGLRIALRAHEQAGNWEAAIQALRQLEKRDALHPAAIRGLKIRAYRALFAARRDDAAAVQALYASVAPADRGIDEIAEAAAQAFAAAGRAEQAARIVEEALETRFVVSLVSLYARLDVVPARERLRRAEAWRGRYGDEPVLLRAVGRLCAAQELWGKAEEFLLHAARLAPERETQLMLAQLYERLGRDREANERYRLAALAGPGALPLPVAAGGAALSRDAAPPSSVR